MRKFFSISMIATAALLAAACVHEPDGGKPDTPAGSNVITVVLGGDEAATKSLAAAPVMDPIDFSEETGVDGLILTETVSSLDELFYGSAESETKAIPIYTQNFDAQYGSQFAGTAFDPFTASGGKYGAAFASELGESGAVLFSKTAANTYSYNYDTVRWPESGKLECFFQAPYEYTKTLSPDFLPGGQIAFDYVDPVVPTSGIIANAATSQKDILFTSKSVEKPSDGAANEHNILLYHALTAVKFKFGNVNEGVETKITKVAIKGLYSSGHCVITPNYTDANTAAGGNASNANNNTSDNVTKSAKCAVWTDLGDPVTYTQTFTSDDVDFAKTEGSATNFGDSFYDGNSNINNMNAADGSETLFLVPQVLEDNDIVVYFSVGGKSYERTVSFSADWKAGELHTYTLTVNRVKVGVEDSMNTDKTVKSNVVTRNDGNVTVYLRATTAIAWYYGYGEYSGIVAPYMGNGTFVGLPGTNWIEGEDGHFYYIYPVKPGQETNSKLFTSFTAPTYEQEHPFDNAHLEVRILLQGVQFDLDGSKSRVDKAWGEVKVKGSSDTVVSRLSVTPEE